MQAPRLDLMQPGLRADILASVRDVLADEEIQTAITLRSRGVMSTDLETGITTRMSVDIEVDAVRRTVGETEAVRSEGALHVGDRVYLIETPSGVSTAVWDEAFEASGYDETWDQGETISTDDGTLPTMDPDAPPPDGVTGWGSSCLEIVCAGDGGGVDPLVTATVRHNGIADAASYRCQFDAVVTEAEAGAFYSLVEYKDTDAQGGSPVMSDMVAAVYIGTEALHLYVRHDGAWPTVPGVNRIEIPLVLGAEISSDFLWNVADQVWSWTINGVVVGSGVITGIGADLRVNEVIVGPRNNLHTTAMTSYVDNVRIETPPPDLAATHDIVDGDEVYEVVRWESDPLDMAYQVTARRS